MVFRFLVSNTLVARLNIHEVFVLDGLKLHGVYWVMSVCVSLTTGVCLTVNPAWNVKINWA